MCRHEDSQHCDARSLVLVVQQRGEIQVHVLGANGYEARNRSVCLPDLDLALVCRLMELPTINDAVRELRAALAKK